MLWWELDKDEPHVLVKGANFFRPNKEEKRPEEDEESLFGEIGVTLVEVSLCLHPLM